MISGDVVVRPPCDGDIGAFEILYDTYAGMVFGIAMRILGSKSASEDVTQIVFLRLLTPPAALSERNPRAWIARVARNCAIDELRRAQRVARLFDFSAGEAERVSDAVIGKVQAEQARAALASLPAEQRSPIELAIFAGLSHREIAERTGVALGTVKSRIRAGLGKIRQAVEDRRL